MNRVTTTNKLCSLAKTGSRNPAVDCRRLRLGKRKVDRRLMQSPRLARRPRRKWRPARTAPDRLDSWKAIAAYLKRDVTTVQRWEKRERMPVHRHVHDKLGSVYAFRSELDAWSRGNPAATEDSEANQRNGATLSSGSPPIADQRDLETMAPAAGKRILCFASREKLTRGDSPGGSSRNGLLLAQPAGRRAVSDGHRFRHRAGGRHLS